MMWLEFVQGLFLGSIFPTQPGIGLCYFHASVLLMGTSKEEKASAISGHKISMPSHQALPLAAHQTRGYKNTFPIKQLLALKQLKVLAEEFSVSQGKVSREEVTQEGKNKAQCSSPGCRSDMACSTQDVCALGQGNSL